MATKPKAKSKVNAAGNYTKPTLRKNIFNRIKAGGKGGAPGQWSARKAQMVASAYKKAGGGWKSSTSESYGGGERKFCQLCGKQESRMECGYGPEMWDKFTIASVHPANEETILDKAKSFKEFAEGAAWTRAAGKNKKGGLNDAGRRSYERENPGSDLKAPSKVKGNKRRDSFCRRMKGMKAKLTSAKTARDPDSRINKSLRAWDCN